MWRCFPVLATAALVAGYNPGSRNDVFAVAESDALVCEAVLIPGEDDDGRLGTVAPGPDGLVAWTTTWGAAELSIGRSMADAITAGRSGSGPGEFLRITGLGWIGDTLWVSDIQNGRVQYFDRIGSYLDGVLTGGDQAWIARPGRRFIALGSKPLGVGSWSVLGRGDGGPEARYDTIHVFPGPDVEKVRIPIGDGGFILTTPEFSADTRVDYAVDGSVFCATEPVAGGQTRLSCVDDVGRTLRDTVLALAAVALTDEVWEATITGYLGAPGATREGIVASLPRPSLLPRVMGLRVGTDRSVWLLRSHRSDTAQRWLRFRPDGTARDTLLVSRNRSISRLSGDTTWIVATDDDGVKLLERCVAKK